MLQQNNSHDLNKERLIVAYGCSWFSPWLLGSMAKMVWWKGMVEEICWAHERQEAENDRERKEPGARIYSSMLCFQLPTSLNQGPPLNSTFSNELINELIHFLSLVPHDSFAFQKLHFWTYQVFEKHFTSEPYDQEMYKNFLD